MMALLKGVIALVGLLACLAAAPAYADCTTPAAQEPAMIYNKDYHTWQFCNGTSWTAMGGGGGGGPITFISTQTASSSATLQWTGLGSSYEHYKLLCTDMLYSGSSATIWLQFGEGGTPTWETSNYQYALQYVTVNGNTGAVGNTSAVGIEVSAAQQAPGNVAASFDGTISNLASSVYKQAHFREENVGGSPGSPVWQTLVTAGVYTGDTNAITAIRLYIDSGETITSGQCSLYGMN